MYNKILVPFDNGIRSQRALNTAIELAKKFQAKIFIFTSLNIFSCALHFYSYTDTALGRDIEERSRNNIEKALQDAAEKVKKEGLDVKPNISDKDDLEDIPGESIIRYAEKEEIDLIVLGSNNLGVFDRVFLGSVSNYVIHNAHCQVLVIKD
ncbi:MAG: putative universal stress protein [Pelotomaculum sp. PtaB.Bin104]|nr:MAG: putative universal stress protein [Pelotomaculum sp. PtaB.Bin104]